MESTLSLFLVLITLSIVNIVQARDQQGFISLDCGLRADEPSPYSASGLWFSSDDKFIQSGRVAQIKENPMGYTKPYNTMRYFPEGIRNCYNLSVEKGRKYLIRATFVYGNYDGLRITPVFDLYLGPNLWDTIDLGRESNGTVRNILHNPTSNSLMICLVKTDTTTPLISSLELRPMGNDSYITNAGSLERYYWYYLSKSESLIRYSDDVYDRIWVPYFQTEWTQISTASKLNNSNVYLPPKKALRNAATRYLKHIFSQAHFPTNSFWCFVSDGVGSGRRRPSSSSFLLVFNRPIMSSLGFSLLFLVSFFVFSELGSPEMSLLRAILQIYSRLTIVVESCFSLPPQHLLSWSSWIWIWIWSPSDESSLDISTASPRISPLLWRNLSLLLSLEKETEAEEEPCILSSGCCICQEKDTSNNFETPCDCKGNLKYAHGICVQQWSNEKHNLTCGMCRQPYHPGYIALSSLTASPNNIIWPSCSAILARFVQRVPSRVAHHSPVESLVWKSGFSKPKFSRFGLSEIYSGLQSDLYSSFKERVSSPWERSILPSSSIAERTFPSSLYSSIEETFGVQTQILPLSMAILLTGFKTQFLSNSTRLESIFQSDSITSVMLHLSDTHVDFYEILQVFQDLKKCFISMLIFRFNLCTSCILRFNCRVFGFITVLCILND